MSDAKRRYVYKDLAKPEGRSYDEIIESLGLGFDAEKRPLKTTDNNGNDIVIPDKVAVWRTDTDDYLATVGDGYGLVQYRQVFSIADVLLGEGIEVLFGGAINRGESAALVLRAPGELELGKGQKMTNECILRSTHDGTGKVEVRMTPRSNTTGIILTTDAMKPLSFKHTKNVENRMADAKRTLRRVHTEWEAFTSAAKSLMTINLNDEEGRSFITSVVGDSESTQAKNIKEKVFDLWKVGVSSRIDVCRGTLFGLVMSFAEWSDFHKTMRKSKRFNNNAAEFNVRVVGDAAKKKAKAWSMALTLRKRVKVGV